MSKYLNVIIAVCFAAFLLIGTQNYKDIQGLNVPENYGWDASKLKSEQLFGDPQVPSGKGKVRLLYGDWEKATGYAYIPRNQNGPDCIGHSMAAGLDFRLAVQAVESVYKVPEYMASAPPIYGLSRIEIAGKPTNARGGSKVIYAMKAMSEYGVLFKKNYLYAGYDLTEYNSTLSRTWGSQGLPDVLEDIAKLTPMVSYYKVTNYKEVRDAIVAGHPVVVGSNIGFSRRTIFSFGRTQATRDRDGFLKRRGSWRHAMVLCGVDDKSYRKGVCCLNSWNSTWIRGPKKLGQPLGSFWIDSSTVTAMAKQGDTFAISHIKAPLNYRLTK